MKWPWTDAWKMTGIPPRSLMKIQVKKMCGFLAPETYSGMAADIGKERCGGALLRTYDQKIR
jgi:hypothetical protein